MNAVVIATIEFVYSNAKSVKVEVLTMSSSSKKKLTKEVVFEQFLQELPRCSVFSEKEIASIVLKSIKMRSIRFGLMLPPI